MSLTENFLAVWTELVMDTIATGSCTYNYTIKFHLMEHIAQMSQYMNPSWTWAYEFEDFCRIVLGCARACVAGTAPPDIPHKVAEHVSLAMELKLQM